MSRFALVDYFVRGGPVMWPLLICSVLGAVFIVERSLAFYRVRANSAEIFKRIRDELKRRNLGGAIEVCNQYINPVAETLKAGLLRFGKSDQEIEKAMESVALHEISKLERGLWILASVANIAPLFGFLGTVTGMINSFEALAEVGLGNPKVVAAGISQALITTAAGLMIALPVQLAYNYYTSRIANFALDVETSSAMLVETFKELEYQPAPTSPKAQA